MLCYLCVEYESRKNFFFFHFFNFNRLNQLVSYLIYLFYKINKTDLSIYQIFDSQLITSLLFILPVVWSLSGPEFGQFFEGPLHLLKFPFVEYPHSFLFLSAHYLNTKFFIINVKRFMSPLVLSYLTETYNPIF